MLALVVVAGDHGSHGQASSLVAREDVLEELGCAGHGELAPVGELVLPAVVGQVGFPVLAVRCAARHGS